MQHEIALVYRSDMEKAAARNSESYKLREFARIDFSNYTYSSQDPNVVLSNMVSI